MIATERRNTAEATTDVVEWLLDPRWPAVRRLTLRTLLGARDSDPRLAALTRDLADDHWVRPLLRNVLRAGSLPEAPVHAYSKWTGAHWRLFGLAELGVTIEVPGAEPPLRDALEQELAWLGSPGRRRRLQPILGRHRNCSSQEGAGIWAAIQLGLGDDPRLRPIVERLIEIQWPDGGWNCDIRPGAHHSSFNESWMPLRSLVAARAVPALTQVPGLEVAIETAAEFFLRHRVVESERTGELASDRVGLFRWPPYWHFALLPGLRTLADAGRLEDPRVRPAIDRMLAQRGDDGRWWPDGRYWTGPGSKGSGIEVVAWGREGEARMLTLQALDVLRHAGIDA